MSTGRGVYLIVCSQCADVYVGSSLDIARRWSSHKTRLRAGHHHAAALQALWCRYGEAAFSCAVVESVARADDLRAREAHWLAEMGSRPAGGVLNTRRYIAGGQLISSEVIVQVTEGGVTWKKRFRGKLLVHHKMRTPDGARAVTYYVYQTEKGRFAVWSQSAPDWNRPEWWRGHSYEDWSGDWWQGESRLDVYETLDDQRDNVPAELHARVAAVVATGSDVEDLDI